MFPIHFFSQIWSQNLAKTVSKDIYTCFMPTFSFPKMIRIRFLIVAYSNNKHKDTVYVQVREGVIYSILVTLLE